MATQTRETARIAVEYPDGRRATVVERTSFTLYEPLSGARQWIPGSKRYDLATGEPVNVNDDDEFELALDGTVLRRV